jgi:two-component system response regulator (stage 0 sporulation protein A)
MHKLLIADGTGNFAKPVMQQLKSEYSILICTDDQQVLSQIMQFDPDILLLDLQLPGADGVAVLRAIRSAGIRTRVIAITPLSSQHILNELALLDVSSVHLTTSRPNAIVNTIHQISDRIDHGEEVPCWDPAIEADKMLLDLGFCMGRGRYTVIHAAVLYVYRNPDCFMTKCLYPDLASIFHTSITQIEKAIRDAIKYAWLQGASGLWKLYLHQNSGVTNKCPSNEVFLAYAAHALRCRKHQSDTPQKIAK